MEERGPRKRHCQERSQLISVFDIVNRQGKEEASINFSENEKLYEKEIINANYWIHQNYRKILQRLDRDVYVCICSWWGGSYLNPLNP